MGTLINAYIMPHAPILIPSIGGEKGREAQASIDGCRQVARRALADSPDTIILSSPHAPCFRDFAVISRAPAMSGNFASFGHRDIALRFGIHTELADAILRLAEEEEIPLGSLDSLDRIRLGIDSGLDHGAMVPLWFLDEAFSAEGKTFRLVHLSTPFFSPHKLHELGKVIGAAVRATNCRAVYIASGDLSHRLTRNAPAGYSPAGRIYDDKLVGLIRAGDIGTILSITEEEMSEAGECGTKSFIMGFGALDSENVRPEVYSYEGPFGVGYLCAALNPESHSGNGESLYVRIARRAVEEYVTDQREIRPAELTEGGTIPEGEADRGCDGDFGKKAGVFVSLKKRGELRGCIGTIAPTCRNIIHEIIQNAISAAAKDPRFDPVRPDELPLLVYSVDVLGEPEKVASMDELDAGRYGVIVTRGFRRGLLLPDLEGVDTPEEQIRIALRKAGISPDESFTIQRFEVVRYH